MGKKRAVYVHDICYWDVVALGLSTNNTCSTCNTAPHLFSLSHTEYKQFQPWLTGRHKHTLHPTSGINNSLDGINQGLTWWQFIQDCSADQSKFSQGYVVHYSDLLLALVSISVNLEITEHTVLKAIYDTRVTFDHTRNVMKGCCVKVWKPVYRNISNGDVSQENLLKLGRDVVPLQQVCKGSIAVITTIVRIVWTNREKFSYSGISTIYSQIRGQWKGRFADTITEYLLYDFEILA